VLRLVAYNDGNKLAIMRARAVEPLVDLLDSGSAEIKEQAVGALNAIAADKDGRKRIVRAAEQVRGNPPHGSLQRSLLQENKGRHTRAASQQLPWGSPRAGSACLGRARCSAPYRFERTWYSPSPGSACPHARYSAVPPGAAGCRMLDVP
jgi:hypothetical protein